MTDEYLWDRSGEPDPLVAHLERAAAPLRFEPAPVLTVPEPAPQQTPAPTRPSTWRHVALTAAIAAAAASLVAWWVAGGVAERATADAPPMAAQHTKPVAVGVDPEPPPATAPSPAPPAIAPPPPPAPPAIAPPPPPAPPAIAPSPPAVAPKPPRRSKTSGGSRSAPRDTPLDVDCILSPDLDKCGDPKQQGRRVDPRIPETLSQADVRAAIAPLKDEARRCGRRHRVTARVKVKMSVAGRTGRVTAATAQAPHRGTAVGRCVAEVLKKARFKRFRKQSIGLLYPIKLSGGRLPPTDGEHAALPPM